MPPTLRAAVRPAVLVRGFGALLGATFVLIVLGALVRANEAGLACPDWPLCFGEVVPRMDVRVAFEWSHRTLAGSIALGFVILGSLTWRSALGAGGIRPLIVVAGLLLMVQILLGALTVWQLLASWTVTSHLLTGNAFAATLLLLTLALRDGDGPSFRPSATVPAAARDRGAVTLVAGLLLLQMLLGGLVSSRYVGMACPEWPTCNGGVWFPSFSGPVGLHLLHRMTGYALLAALAGAAWLCRRTPGLQRLTLAAFGLGAAQVLVGIANVKLAIPVEVTGMHSALGASLVLMTTMTLREVWRSRHEATAAPGC